MGTLGDAVRVVVVAASAVAAIGSATPKQPLQASYFTKAQPGPPPIHACKDACDQVSACDLTPFDACFKKCRDDGTEQQPDGPDRLALMAQESCEDLATTMQARTPNQPPLPSFGESAIPSSPVPGGPPRP